MEHLITFIFYWNEAYMPNFRFGKGGEKIIR